MVKKAAKIPSKKIGGVELIYIQNTKDTTYSDGPVEDEILKIFKSKDSNERINQALHSNPAWPMYYHLTPKRKNLLGWYNFNEGSDILEIGAGCGAITESIVDKDVKIDALELTEKRSLINAHRNTSAKNLKILVGNLQSLSPTKKYDYIVCVGVLEYAGMFIKDKDPYNKFLMLLTSVLKTGGKLLLTIEKKQGLKYWTGAKEDHTDSYFEGINGYPGKKAVRTFGKLELESLLLECGLSKTYFFFPYPDYKTPQLVYSEDYHPGNGCSFPLGLLPTPTLDTPREVLASEQSIMMTLEKNNLFKEFSNSFLVEATK